MAATQRWVVALRQRGRHLDRGRLEGDGRGWQRERMLERAIWERKTMVLGRSLLRRGAREAEVPRASELDRAPRDLKRWSNIVGHFN